MKLLKKVSAIVLFLSLISSFILYKTDYYKSKGAEHKDELISHNYVETRDTLNWKKRLIINYDLILKLDNLNASASREAKKTITLEYLQPANAPIMSGSKSIVLSDIQGNIVKDPSDPVFFATLNETIRLATKNESFRKRLRALNIERVRFSTNRVFDGIPSDVDLMSAIMEIENKQLPLHSNKVHYLDPENVNTVWQLFKDSRITIHFEHFDRVIISERTKVDAFLEWYNKEAREKADQRFKMYSSKSMILTDSKTTFDDVQKERALFKKNVKKYLDIEL